MNLCNGCLDAMDILLGRDSRSNTTSSLPDPASLTDELVLMKLAFQKLDGISPDVPANASLNIAKLRHILATHGGWMFDDEEINDDRATNSVSRAMLAKRRAANEAALKDMIRSVDLNQNGKIEFNEFVKLIEMHRSKHKSSSTNSTQRFYSADDEPFVISPENVRLVFDAFDSDADGFISVTDIRSLFESQNCSFWTENQLNQLISRIDPDGAGKIGFSSFYALMNQSSN